MFYVSVVCMSKFEPDEIVRKIVASEHNDIQLILRYLNSSFGGISICKLSKVSNKNTRTRFEFDS